MESIITSPASQPVAEVRSAGGVAAGFDQIMSREAIKVQDTAMDDKATLNSESIRPAIPQWKRALDFLLILIGLPLWLPVAVVLALVIRLGSRGPVFFRQHRVGQGGRIFVCFKFRTMHFNANQTAHQEHVRGLIKSSIPMVKLDGENDARLIPGGALIRATGLDELPQLINILRGEMSIVGPRPCIPYEYEMYEPWQRHRCDAPPGLTGLWQVSGKNRTTFDEMVHLDTDYAKRMSPWLDLRIIARTPIAILQQLADTRRAKKQGR